MGKLTSVSPDLVCDSLMRIVPSGITSTSLAARHGAVLLAAEVILSLSIIGAIPAAVAEEVSQIVIKLDKARMYRYFNMFWGHYDRNCDRFIIRLEAEELKYCAKFLAS